MTTNAERVKEFRDRFGLCTPSQACLIDAVEFMFRFELILEETKELFSAYRSSDVVGIADALADLLYVTYGLAHEHGIPIDEVFAEVHRANMTKVRASTDGSDSKRGSTSDVVKPADFCPPDVERILRGTVG